MATWTRMQVELMARSVGWGARSEDISHVAMAESGGDDKIVNSIGCVGLLQINQPVHVAAHPKWTRKWLQNPINNLTAGLVLYKAAGEKLDGPWLDSRDKGGGGGWGSKVSGSGGGTGTSQASDEGNSCALLDGQAREVCERDSRGGGGGGGVLDTAEQIGRLAQAVAKAGNWLAEPANWVRIVYVGGGALLALTAVSVIVRPYVNTAYGQVYGALPVKTVKKAAARVRTATAPQEESK